MAEFIKVKAELDGCMRFLESLEGNQKAMRRRILSGTGTAVKNKIKKSYGGLLNKRSGNLCKSIKSRVIKAGNAAVVYPHAERNRVRYGFVLARGGEIKAKGDGFLTFRIDEKWMRKKSVTLRPRDWVAEPAKRYLDSAEYRSRLDSLIQREIDRAENGR